MIFEKIRAKEYESAIQLLKADSKLLQEKNEHGYLPLHYAIEYGHDAVANYIIPISEHLDAEGIDNYTPLHHAISHTKSEIIELLIKHGCDINYPYANGNSPFANALMRYKNDPTPLRLLMKANANPTSKNKHGIGIENLFLMPKNKDIVVEVKAYYNKFK